MGETWVTVSGAAARKFGERHYAFVMFVNVILRPLFFLLLFLAVGAGVVLTGFGFVEYGLPWLELHVLPAVVMGSVFASLLLIARLVWMYSPWSWMWSSRLYTIGTVVLSVGATAVCGLVML